MKKASKLYVLLIIALTAFFAVSVLVLSGGNTARAYSEYDEPTNTYISGYSVYYDIKNDRSMSVTEDITVSFDNRSGVVKYIPVNAGEQVRNLKVYELVGSNQATVQYDVSFEDEAIFIDIGDYRVKNEEHTYRLTYEYCLTKAQEGKNVLALTPVGADWPCAIENVDMTFKLPGGYVKGSAKCFVNYHGRTDIDYRENVEADGRTTIHAEISRIEKGSEVRLDTSFEDGVLSTYSDPTPYLFLIPAFVIIAVIVLLKLFVFNKDRLTPVVNYEAPNGMDPLIMGKLIDNKVNSEDLTSLIFYWASKGYIKINLDNQNDPSIIRIVQKLPENSPEYERHMFYGLFRYGEVVKPSQLKYSFYKVTEQVTSKVNSQAQGLYNTKSFAVSVLFTILGGILLGLAPLIFGMMQISTKLTYLLAFAVIAPIILIYMGAVFLKYNSLKFKKQTLVLAGFGIALVCVITGVFYVLLVPSCIMSIGQKIALFISCCPIFTLSVLLISRTNEYTKKLNDIVGFKNFILLAEKDRLEMMLEEDPQFYYNILPYAQVLGITDKWEEKFADITVQPPQWLTGNFLQNYIEFRIINSIIRNSMRNISSNMVSRPSSSGRSGGSHGGSFGGFSGGGHGGGGGHFR